MATIQDLIDHYPEIIQAITVAEFSSPVLFKGFCKTEENRFFLLVENNSSAPLLDRLDSLETALQQIMRNCNITINTPEDFNERYLKKLNSDNSVALTASPPVAELERVFAHDWEFTPLHNSTQRLTAQTQMWQPVAVHDEHANHARVSPTPTPIAGHS